MPNFSIRHDLLQVKGAFVTNIKGKTETKRCLCIPIDEESGLILGEKGCYLNTVAIEMREQKYVDTHCIKVDFPKEVKEKMTEEELRATPIIGGLHAIVKTVKPMPVTTKSEVENADDLPF
jgi:hypothetical protein